MTSSLDSFVSDAATGLLLPPSARRQVIPYGDLQVLNWPTTQPSISNDLLSTLAIGVAQGKDAPRLLMADGRGALIVNAHINALTTFAAPFTGGSTVPQVVDTSGFYPGQNVVFASQTGSGASCGGMTILTVPDATHLTVFSSCGGQNFVPGDFVIGKQSVTIDPTATFFPFPHTDVDVVSGGARPFDPSVLFTSTIYKHLRMAVDPARSADLDALVANATPGAASLSFPATGVGFRHTIKDMLWTVDNRSAAAFVVGLRVWDGASGVGQLKWFTTMNVPANSTEKLPVYNLLQHYSDNTQTVLDFSGGAANVNESIYASIYIEG